MERKSNTRSPWRCLLLKLFYLMHVPPEVALAMLEPMEGRSDTEKEIIAKEIIYYLIDNGNEEAELEE